MIFLELLRKVREASGKLSLCEGCQGILWVPIHLCNTAELGHLNSAAGWYDFDGGTIGITLSAVNLTGYVFGMIQPQGTLRLDFGYTAASGTGMYKTYDYSGLYGVFLDPYDPYTDRTTNLYHFHCDVE